MKTDGLHHVAINVHELQPALDFYVGQLGFSVVESRPDFGFPGAWLQAGGHQIHLMEVPTATIDRGQHLALRVHDLDAAVAELEASRERGVRYLVIPKPAFWWLGFYIEFAQHLRERYSLVYTSSDCLIYELAPSENGNGRRRLSRLWLRRSSHT